MKKNVLAIFLATLWISISEFVRNEFLLKSYWTKHYADLGLIFPSEQVNGAVWGIWSLCLALAIFFMSKKFNLLQTTFISWFFAFVLMWLVIGNMSVLPYGILPFAIPLSFLEVFLASYIIQKLANK